MDPETRLELETVMNSSSTELIDTKHSTLDNAHGHIQTNSSGTREFMRLFKLQIFSLFWAWKAPLERPKVAIYGNRSIAALHALLHVVPLGGAIPLLVLNWTSYFIGLAPPDARSLQFAAKFHEILMQASIFEIILAIIRSQIVEDYVPLGALSASMQASQLSYIWSLDFVAAVAHSASHGWRKMLVVAMILLLTILTALVGPSSAVLMIPRAGLPHVLETVEQHANISTKELFPDRVNKTHNMNFNLDKLNIGPFMSELEQEDYDSQTIPYSANMGLWRVLRLSTHRRFTYKPSGLWYSTTATIPTRVALETMFSGDARKLTIGNNNTMLVHIPHPLVVARCTPSVSAEKEDMIIPYLQDDGIKEGRLLSVSTLIHTYIERGVSNETMLDSLPPIWLPSPELNSSSVIGVFTDPPSYCRDNLSYPISVMYAEEHRNTTSTCLPLLTCSVSAFWEVSRHETVIVGGKPMAQTSEFVDAGFSKVSYQNPIALDLARIPLFNDANFTRSLQITPYGLCLAAMMVTALAEVPSRFALSTIPTNTTILPIYKFTWVKHGYGYNLSPTSVRLSFSIIAMYCTVAIAYLLYVLFTGTTSSAWNSPIELVLLALRSRRPDNLDHVSVGAECLKTYQKAVGIRVNSKEELELVFADTRDVGANELHKIVRNQSY